MAIKVNVGFTRKVGEPHYGSRGASLHLEVELEQSAMADGERFRSEIERIFEQARDAVNKELQRKESPSSLEPPRPAEESAVSSDRNGQKKSARPATANQIRAIRTIAHHQGIDLGQLLDAEFNGKITEELTIVEASFLINQLKSFPRSFDPDLGQDC